MNYYEALRVGTRLEVHTWPIEYHRKKVCARAKNEKQAISKIEKFLEQNRIAGFDVAVIRIKKIETRGYYRI